MKSKYLKLTSKLNISTLILFIILNCLYSCTRILLFPATITQNQKLIIQNNFKDFNPKKQSLYINFLNPDTKQIVVLEMDSDSLEDTVKFNGSISDYNKTYSQKFEIEIPIIEFNYVQINKSSNKSFTIKKDTSKYNYLSSYSSKRFSNTGKYFDLGLPALIHSINNLYTDDGIIQTMNGIISTPLNSKVIFYAISDFVPFIIWGGVLAVGAIFTHLSWDSNEDNCEEIVLKALKLCKDKDINIVTKRCEFSCVKNNGGKYLTVEKH